MLKFSSVMLFIFSISCGPQKINKTDADIKVNRFYVSTYTNNDSKGIYEYGINSTGKLTKLGLAAEIENPSFLAKSVDQKYLLVVSETEDDSNGGGTISSFKIEKDKLTLLSTQESGGASPCFVAVDESGIVLTANYSSGTIGLLKLNKDGKLQGPLDVEKHTGQGTHARQTGPHAHSVWFVPEENLIVSVDLGTNDLWFSKIDKKTNKLIPEPNKKLAMKEASGPRHLAFHPTKKILYVLNEMAGSITRIDYDDNENFIVKESYSSLIEGADISANNSADIHISSDGRFLYASNRGPNNIGVFAITGSGDLQVVEHVSTKGDAPRNFSFSPGEKFLLVANQNSNNIISFKRNEESGKLTYADSISAPTPVCILF